MHLVLQANPCNLKFDQVETILRDSVCNLLISLIRKKNMKNSSI